MADIIDLRAAFPVPPRPCDVAPEPEFEAKVEAPAAEALANERYSGHFRPLGKAQLRTHMWELFATIQARLTGEAKAMARPKADAVALRLDSLSCGMRPHVAGVITDPVDGQLYRLILVPANVTVKIL